MSRADGVLDGVTDRVADGFEEIKPRLRGWLHAGTAPLAFFSFLVMLVLAEGLRVRAGVAVFMISALLLFTTSAVFHTGTWSPRTAEILRRFDHANIFILIAGSTTPLAILLLTHRHAVLLLSMMWGGTALGILFKVFWLGSPRWLHVFVYLLLGWVPVVFLGDFVDTAPTVVLVLLATGGLLYSVGAVVYGARWPDPSPTYFGYHEVFHTMTIVAFFLHYAAVSLLVYAQH